MPNRVKGWIQDPGSLDNLIKVVDVFNYQSKIHIDLISKIIPAKVLVKDGKINFIKDLNSRNGYLHNPKIKYKNLVGTAFYPRSNARCNGIIQALIPGQRRSFISDWPANNFVRWAETLGFIQYSDNYDSYTITDFGLQLSSTNSTEIKFKVIKQALLHYPPVTRILELLYEQFKNNQNIPSLTKFELGLELGFKGEDGFTHYPQHIIVQEISLYPENKNKILSDWEGSSDKYARMICGWLSDTKINWLIKEPKSITISIGNQSFTADIPQSYKITSKGIRTLRKSRARGRHAGVSKKVFFEMLATKGLDREYLRMRRALTIKYLKQWRTLNQIKNHLNDHNIKNVPTETIFDDINNFQRIGLEVKNKQDKYRIVDEIIDLQIPILQYNQLQPSDFTKTKQILSEEIKFIDHSFFDLIDLSFNGKQNRLFELKIVELLNLIITAKHLSGGNRPEIIGYNPKLNPRECIIMDSKAYGTGFSIPAHERDKMIRYIGEYNEKNENLNTNKWWENFKSHNYPINPIIYCFVSSFYRGNFINQLNYILLRTSTNGGVITSENLIRKIDAVINPTNNYNVKYLFKDIGCNGLV